MSESFLLTRQPSGAGAPPVAATPDSSVVSHPTPMGDVDVSPEGRAKSMRRAVREASPEAAAAAAAADQAVWTAEGAAPPQLYDRAPPHFGFAGAGLHGYGVVGGHEASLLEPPSLQTTLGLVRVLALPLALLCPLLGVVLVLAALVIWTPGAGAATALGVGDRGDALQEPLGGWLGSVCDEVAAASPGDLQTAGWSAEDIAGCCRIRGVGCTAAPSTTPRATTASSTAWRTTAEDEYDCMEDYQHWRDVWPDRKKDWCCYQYSRGCDD